MQSSGLKFRLASRDEVAAFRGQLKDQLGVTEAQQLPDSLSWILAEGPRTEAYLVSEAMRSSLGRLWKVRMPYSLGLFAGGVQRERLSPSLELISYLTDVLPEGKIVFLKEQAEQPVLYGRDVLAGSVEKIERAVGKGELVALANNLREILALGSMLTDAQSVKHAAPSQRVIRNLIDKGWYLRKGG